MMGGSLMWSFVAYGLVGVLIAFTVGIVVMMVLASKDDKKRNAALPMLSPEETSAESDDFIFASEFDQEKTPASTGPKKPSRPFFKTGTGATPKASKSAASAPATDMSFFEQDDFDITEGSDLNTPQ